MHVMLVMARYSPCLFGYVTIGLVYRNAHQTSSSKCLMGGGVLPLWESVGMRHGFAPHFRHLDDLFAPQNLTLSTILFRSCWVQFRSPPFSACRRSFCPPNWLNLSFYSDLVGSILNFEQHTPTDFDPEWPPPTPPPSPPPHPTDPHPHPTDPHPHPHPTDPHPHPTDPHPHRPPPPPHRPPPPPPPELNCTELTNIPLGMTGSSWIYK